MARATAPFVLHLELTGGPERLSRRLSTALVVAIAGGQLVDGDLVPSTRTLAANLRIARSVVVDAYTELIAAGFLVARPGSATRIGPGAAHAARSGAFGSPAVQPPAVQPASVQPPNRLRALDPVDDVLFNLLPGFPDTTLINARDWQRSWRTAARRVLTDLSDGGPNGTGNSPLHTLRIALANHLRRSRGMLVDPQDLLVFPRVGEAIRILSALVMKPGHSVAFEDPGYPTGRRAFVAGGSTVRPVPVDDQGLLVDRLTDADYAVYVTPAHQYPLGSRLSVKRRSALLDWAAENSAVIFEDDYDGEFRYDVAPMPTLRAMAAGADRVIYLGTASKILSRDMAIAWAVVPAWLRRTLNERQVELDDLLNTVAGSAFAAFIETGALTRQLTHSHRTYAARRDRFAVACRKLLPGTTLHGVEAGLHVVLTFEPEFDDVTAVRDLWDAGLKCAPLSDYFQDPAGPGKQGLVCGYSRLPETRAFAAVDLIREILGSRAGLRSAG